MKKLLLATLISCCFLMNAHAANLESVTGKSLLSPTENITLDLKSGKKATVVVFMSAVCPCSGSHEGLLKKMAQDFSDFQFVAVHANIDEKLEDSQKHFKEAALGFPVIEDSRSVLANHFGALKTPHVYVLGPQGEMIYQGGVTDSHVGPTAKKQYLQEVLTDLQAGQVPRHKETRSLGCYIQRAEK